MNKEIKNKSEKERKDEVEENVRTIAQIFRNIEDLSYRIWYCLHLYQDFHYEPNPDLISVAPYTIQILSDSLIQTIIIDFGILFEIRGKNSVQTLLKKFEESNLEGTQEIQNCSNILTDKKIERILISIKGWRDTTYAHRDMKLPWEKGDNTSSNDYRLTMSDLKYLLGELENITMTLKPLVVKLIPEYQSPIKMAYDLKNIVLLSH